MSESRNIETLYRLSPTQEGILYHSLESADAGVYAGQYTCVMTGDIDPNRLHLAWTALVTRHASLRTLFAWQQKSPLQIVRKSVDLPWKFEDWRSLDRDSQSDRWQQLVEDERDTGFALDKAPLVRIALVRVDDRRYRFLIGYHHIVLDGWSLRLLLDEAAAVYRVDAGAEEADALPYAEFIGWHDNADWTEADAFWRRQLHDVEAATPIPLPASDATGQSRASSHCALESSLGKDQVARFEAFARGHRVTLNTLFVGAWAVLLSRYADSADVLFGTTWAGRSNLFAGAEQTVGLFINTLPTRVLLPAQPVSAWLGDLMANLNAMREFEQTPLTRAQRVCRILAGQPMFESIMVFQSVPDTDEGNDVWQTVDETYSEHSNYPLALLVRPGTPFTLTLVHDERRFCRASIDGLLKHFLTVLEQLVANPEIPVTEIEAVSGEECEWLLAAGRGPDSERGAGTSVDDMIDAVAARTPDTTALVQDEIAISYREFESRADTLARHLRQMCHRRDGGSSLSGFFGAVFIERSPAAMTAMFAVLKAGGAYVPMDPGYPAERSLLVLDDLAAAARSSQQSVLLITERTILDRLPDTELPVICIDDAPELTDSNKLGEDEARRESACADERPAYVMYTSGSSGRPKGTRISHRSLVNSTLARTEYYPQSADRFLMLSSLAADSSIAGIFWTLCGGGTLVLPRPGDEQSVARLGSLIERERISHMLCLPSIYALILENADRRQLKSLRCVVVAGEYCPPELLDAHVERMSDTALYNEYGPSEATVWATVARLEREHRTDVPIGRPIANVRTYVLDKRRRLVPTGLPGELYIGGRGVALDYLGRDELTASAFSDDPFDTDGAGRLYRTGDRVRLMPDGMLRFLGRVDNQLKVHGHRVEPEEIEMALLRLPGVTEAAVVLAARSDTDEVQSAGRLTAFVVWPGEPPASAALRERLATVLPDFMIPQAFVVLDALPRAPGGKTDLDELRQRAGKVRPSGSSGEARTDNEKLLACIWSEVLECEQVGIDDNFFELGGDSLLSIRILARASKEGLDISPADFFAQPTVAGQANVAVRRESAATTPRKSPKRFSLTKLDVAGLDAVAEQLSDIDSDNQPE